MPLEFIVDQLRILPCADCEVPVNVRIRQILEDLEALRENLLGLSDDIWLSIDHNDPHALEEGVQFKRSYNEKVAAFDHLASELSGMVQQFTAVRLEESEQAGGENQDENVRIIRELNREEPHSIDEDFTFRRPHGFILDGQAVTGVTTWRRMYELVCQQLLRKDRAKFYALPNSPRFITNRGHREFSSDPSELRSAGPMTDNLYAEINHSANGLRNNIQDLSTEFSIPKESLQIYLREDRDAERDRDTSG